MKLAVMKLTSLLVLLIGILPIALMFTEVPYVEHAGTVLSSLSGIEIAEEITVVDKIITIIVAVVLIVVGLYGFIPALGRNKTVRELIIKGDQGDIKLNMDSVQVNLARQLTDMKEVHKAKLAIEPIKGGKSATLHAVVEIEKLPGISTRETANAITANLTRNAKEVLGLEDLLKVKLDIEGIHLDENTVKLAETASPQLNPDSNNANLVQDKVDAVSKAPAATVAPIVAAESEVPGSSFDISEKQHTESSNLHNDTAVSDISEVDEVRISNDFMDSQKESDIESSSDFRPDEEKSDSFGWRDSATFTQDAEKSENQNEDTGFSFLDDEDKTDSDENKPRGY